MDVRKARKICLLENIERLAYCLGYFKAQREMSEEPYAQADYGIILSHLQEVLEKAKKDAKEEFELL